MNKLNYDSEFCGNLPIHQINQIQSYGVLVVLHADSLMIQQVSENADSIFGKPIASLVGTSIHDHVQEDALETLTSKPAQDIREPLPLIWKIDGKSYLTLVHRKENLLLAEIDLLPSEDGKQLSFIEVYKPIKVAMALIAKATSISEVAVVAARELQRISGFDKVMIYRFDSEWNGNVIAEECPADMESYMGFTFPASDIPKPARDLYLRNPYRFIPTRNYQPVKLYPVINPETQSFIDLSDCNLRSVAQVHLEYLKNMKVTASMSTRILVEDKLWGLVACHHKSTKMIHYEMRSVFEMLSSIISQKIAALEHQEGHKLQNRLKDEYNRLVENSFREKSLGDKLLNGEADLLKLFSAVGVVLSYKGRMFSKGVVPETEKMKELLMWLHTRQLRNIFTSESLGSLYDVSHQYKEIASGILVIPIDSAQDEYLIVFRPEVLRTIHWGGNPDERIQFEQDERTYHPRHSFKLWQQHVQGTSAPWRNEEIKIAEHIRAFITEYYH